MPFKASLHKNKYPFVTLKDTITGAEAEIYSFGGLLNAFRIPVRDTVMNVVDGFKDVADAEKNITQGFRSAKLSPFVCRMQEGRYRFADKEYRVAKHYLGRHAIHGLIYDGIYQITAIEQGQLHASVSMTHVYEGTDQGYPFPFEVTLTWKLESGNRLTVSTTVVQHHQTPIPFADGWHPYFRLGGLADEWVLQFGESSFLEYDEELIPTGKKINDTRFLQGASLQGIQLDNGFEWASAAKSNQCVLSNDLLRLTVEPDSSYPVLQLYIPPHRKSIAIETLSGAPDNFNNGMNLVVLAPGEPKTFSTSYGIAVL